MDAIRRQLDDLAPRVAVCDPDAVAETYRLLEPMLAAVAASVVGNPATAQDVVHDAFLRLLDHAAELRDPDGRALRAWLVRTVRNRALDLVTSGRARFEQVQDQLPDWPVHDQEPFDDELRAALQGLSADHRDALVLFHVAGLDGAEVAAALGRNRAATYALLRRAERSLRDRLRAVRSDSAGSSPKGRT